MNMTFKLFFVLGMILLVTSPAHAEDKRSFTMREFYEMAIQYKMLCENKEENQDIGDYPLAAIYLGYIAGFLDFYSPPKGAKDGERTPEDRRNDCRKKYGGHQGFAYTLATSITSEPLSAESKDIDRKDTWSGENPHVKLWIIFEILCP